MINAILTGVFSLVISLINVILAPIDLLINNLLPDIALLFTYVNNLIDFLIESVRWGVSWTGLKPELISIFVAIKIFKVNSSLLTHAVKTAIDWYNSLKL